MKIFWAAVFLVLCCQSHAWRSSKKLRPPPDTFCDPVKCEGNCRERLGADRCPMCICDPLCSPPKCPPGCKVETNFKGPCPGCDCGQGDEVIDVERPGLTKPLCDPVKCVGNCREALGPNGCPTCLCDPLCSPPKCDPGCEIEIEFEGPCPGCKCDGGKAGLPGFDLAKALCDPVKCRPDCQEALGPSGCPTCLCGPLCSPPKCEPGCEIETDFEGPCPGCKCDGGKGKDKFDRPDLAKALCDPVKCFGICKEALGSNGCPMCLCDPLCSPPKCPPGCEVQTVFDGPCPGCDCKKDDVDDIKSKCPPVEECSRLDCSKKLDEFGCETCVCGPICDIPKCRFGCRLQPAKPPHPCPSCVCVRPWSKGRNY